MTDLEIAKTLKDAAQYIRDHGKERGSLGRDGGPRCALGAIASAAGAHAGSSEYHVVEALPAAAALAAALPPPPEFMLESVYRFSDDHTAAEVIDLFESVALQHELRALAGTGGVESADAIATPTLAEGEAGCSYATSLEVAL